MRFKLRDLQDALSVFGQKTWVVLNSQFTLWALGGLAAVVGTVIAMAYSDVKNCRKELDDLRDQYEKASNEVWARYSRLVNAFEKKADWSDPELMKFLDEDTFRREFRDWKYMDVELEAERLLRKLKGSTNFGERACKGGHECSAQVLLQKYRKQKDYDPANILFQNRDNWTRTWHPLGTLREIDNLQLASKCSLGASLSGIISFS